MAPQFTDREKQLLAIFYDYLQEVFNHGDSVADTTLCELVQLHVMDDVLVAGELAKDYGDMAGEICLRAHHWHSLAKELTQFIEADGPEDIKDLPGVHRMRIHREIKEQAARAVVGRAQEPSVPTPGSAARSRPSDANNQVPLTVTTEEPVRDPWAVLSDLRAIAHTAREHVDTIELNARDATAEEERECDFGTIRQIIDREYHEYVACMLALGNYVEELYDYVRQAKVPS